MQALGVLMESSRTAAFLLAKRNFRNGLPFDVEGVTIKAK